MVFSFCKGITFFCIVFFISFAFNNFDCTAQVQDEEIVINDSTEVQDSIKSSAPRKIKDRRARNATIMSALVPGLGQVYNKKYWKVPIIYGLGAVLGYYIVNYNNGFQHFKQAYEDTILRKKDPTYNRLAPSSYLGKSTDKLDPSRLKRERDNFRDARDFDIILSIGLYVLNIVDATVDAHLRSFDVSDKLTLHIDPKFNSGINNSLAPGISMNFKFK